MDERVFLDKVAARTGIEFDEDEINSSADYVVARCEELAGEQELVCQLTTTQGNQLVLSIRPLLPAEFKQGKFKELKAWAIDIWLPCRRFPVARVGSSDIPYYDGDQCYAEFYVRPFLDDVEEPQNYAALAHFLDFVALRGQPLVGSQKSAARRMLNTRR